MDEHKFLHQPVGIPVGKPMGKPIGGGGNFLGPLFGVFSTKSLRYSAFLLKSLRYSTILGADFQFPPKSLPYSTTWAEYTKASRVGRLKVLESSA